MLPFPKTKLPVHAIFESGKYKTVSLGDIPGPKKCNSTTLLPISIRNISEKVISGSLSSTPSKIDISPSTVTEIIFFLFSNEFSFKKLRVFSWEMILVDLGKA